MAVLAGAGHYEEGGRRQRTLLDATDAAAPAVRAKAMTSAALLCLSTHPLVDQAVADEARCMFEEAMAIRRALGDRRGVASALHGLGGLHFRRDEPEAARACFEEETLAIGRELGDTQLVAGSLNNLANLALFAANHGRPPPEGLDARALYEESLRLWRELGDDLGAARVMGDLSVIATRTGRYDDAAAVLAEGAEIYRRLGVRRGYASYTTNLASLARRKADYAGARYALEGLLQTGRELGDAIMEARSLSSWPTSGRWKGIAARPKTSTRKPPTSVARSTTAGRSTTRCTAWDSWPCSAARSSRPATSLRRRPPSPSGKNRVSPTRGRLPRWPTRHWPTPSRPRRPPCTGRWSPCSRPTRADRNPGPPSSTCSPCSTPRLVLSSGPPCWSAPPMPCGPGAPPPASCPSGRCRSTSGLASQSVRDWATRRSRRRRPGAALTFDEVLALAESALT